MFLGDGPAPADAAPADAAPADADPPPCQSPPSPQHHRPRAPQVVTELEEAIYDADIVINGLPSTETRGVFERIARVWKATRDASQTDPVVISLSKGVETSLEPHPHIITPTRVIHEVTGVPLANLMYLGERHEGRVDEAAWGQLGVAPAVFPHGRSPAPTFFF